jgi:hypothetical protein
LEEVKGANLAPLMTTENLRCQFGTSSLDHGGRRHLPFVFTENGVAMLSSVLNSDRAVQINITIMRIFTKLRSFLAMEHNRDQKLDNLREDTGRLFRIVFERLDNVEERQERALPEKRRKIGLQSGAKT